MALTPETKFRNKVHKYRKKHVYQQKENNQFRGGIPDDYYESYGTPGILRVEYKFVAKPPKVINLLSETTKPALSKLQQDWIDRCYGNGHQIAVIVGTNQGGIILTHRRWKKPITREWFEQNMKNPLEIMEWVERQVTMNVSTANHSGPDSSFQGDYPRLQ